MRSAYFIEPLDVLFLRGNKLFGDPGSFGESLIPPWPSAAAGALRTALLAHKDIDLAAYAEGEIDDRDLGTPERPGPFTVTAFQLARRDAAGRVDPLHALPADLVASKGGDRIELRRLAPHPPAAGLRSSAATAMLPVLAERERSKPVSGLWLTGEGWAAYLAGQLPDAGKHLLRSSELWRIDTRTGVGLDPAQRRAADGKLFTVQAAAMVKRGHRIGTNSEPIPADYDVGFLAETAGASVPETLILRLGGDGRGALARRLEQSPVPEPDYEALCRARRCRLVLTTPGIFSTPLGERPEVRAGWLPTGTTPSAAGGFRFELHGVEGRLISAAVPRAEVVSGWDLAKRQPKPAQRAAPTGSVYWLDELEATPEALRKLAERGLWSEPEENAGRRAEGFNRVALAAWR